MPDSANLAVWISNALRKLSSCKQREFGLQQLFGIVRAENLENNTQGADRGIR